MTEYIEPEDVDTCVSWGIGYKIAVVGPMALLDMAGLDIYKSVSSFLNADLSSRGDVAPMIAGLSADVTVDTATRPQQQARLANR